MLILVSMSVVRGTRNKWRVSSEAEACVVRREGVGVEGSGEGIYGDPFVSNLNHVVNTPC